MSSVDQDYRDRQIGEFFKALVKLVTLGIAVAKQKIEDGGLGRL